MTVTTTVGGNDLSAYVRVESIQIQETAAGGRAATASFQCVDATASLTIAIKDDVVIDDGGTTYFKGEVAGVPETHEIAPNKLVWQVKCQDYNQLLNETVVSSETWDVSATSDSTFIDTLVSTHRTESDIDSTTYVSTIKNADDLTDDITVGCCTLAEALSEVCKFTGGRFYLDFDKNLHYYATSGNTAAVGLSDSFDGSSTFRYWNLRRLPSVGLVNRVFIQGTEISAWAQDDTSVASYGEREVAVYDEDITTAAAIVDRAASIITANKNPPVTYTLKTQRGGFVAGQLVEVTSSVYSLSAEALLIQKISTTFLTGAKPVYTLTLGDPIYDAVTAENARADRLRKVEKRAITIGDSVYDTDAPSAPDLQTANLSTGVIVDADGHQIVYVQVTWGVVSAADLDHYEVQISTSSDFSGYTVTRHHPADGDRIERFTGLVGSTTYYVRVRAVDWVGNASAWSTVRSISSSADSTPPGQVGNLVAAGARTLIGLTWDANSEADMSYYEIQRCGDSGGSPDGSWATVGTAKMDYYIDHDHTEAAIQAGTTYHYQVRAVDTSGNAGTYSSSASAALNPIGSDTIAAGAIITAKLAADCVTADKIDVNQLSAIAADMGTITAGTVTGATIRTAASGARVQMDSSNGIIVYNASAETVFQVNVTGAGQIGKTGLNPIIWNAAGQLDQLNANQITIGPGGGNVLDNSAFLSDDDADGVADGWTEVQVGDYNTPTLSTVYHRFGGQSQRVDITALASEDDYWLIYQSRSLDECGLVIGDDFVLSGHMLTTGLSDATAQLYVKWYDVTPSDLQTDIAASMTAANNIWTHYNVTNTIPATAVSCRVYCRLRIDAGAGQGIALWDGIQLERGDVCSSWKPGLVGNVTIDATRVEVLDDAGGRVWMGMRGADLGAFGEDSGGNLEVAWYANGANAGKIMAGAGTVMLDTDGITIATAASELYTTNALKFEVSGTEYASLSSWYASVINEIVLRAEDIASKNTIMHIQSHYPESGSLYGDVVLIAEGAEGNAPAELTVYSCNDGTRHISLSPYIRIGDGTSAPAAAVGWASIYVDSADGDLKVRFGDGHTVTLAADS